MSNRKTLLHALLRTLVQEWGYKTVATALSHVAESATKSGDQHLSAKDSNEREVRRKSTKLLASEQVASAPISEVQRSVLRELATRFDRKEILPSTSDVREFLIMMGERPGGMKNRSEAFRRLLVALSHLSPERLAQLVNSAHHAGPSQLGPLSDAISSVASSLPRSREPHNS